MLVGAFKASRDGEPLPSPSGEPSEGLMRVMFSGSKERCLSRSSRNGEQSDPSIEGQEARGPGRPQGG